MEEQEKLLNDVTQGDYKYGFVTDIETDIIEKGLNEDVIRIISAKKKNLNLC
jgi:Fe-S cluster assembly protein SufB